MKNSFFSKVKTYFITGIAVILPTFITILVVKWLLVKTNLWFIEPFVKFARPYITHAWLLFIVKIAVFCLIVVIIILCGAATKVIYVRRFFRWGEQFVTKMPVVSKVYIATKEISAALFGGKKGAFNRVVLVEYPRAGLFAVGFVTADHIRKEVIKRPLADELTSVFIPTTPNPTTGTFVFVPKKDLIDVDMSVEEAVKIILSGGALLPAAMTAAKEGR